MTKEQDIKALAEIIAKHDFDNENFEAEWFNATSAEKNQYRINAKDLAATIYNAGYRLPLPVKHTPLSDEEMKMHLARHAYITTVRERILFEDGFRAGKFAQVDKDNTR